MIENNQLPADAELETTDNSYWVKQYEALERLYDNDDFKTVIMDGYFKRKAIDGVSMLGTHTTRANGSRPMIMEELVAISALEEHFSVIKNIGAPIEDDEETED